MRSKLISIQVMLIPHLEVIERELKIAQDLITKDQNLSVAEILIDLAIKLQLHNQILEIARSTWNHALTMITKVHKEFIETYGLLQLFQPQQ